MSLDRYELREVLAVSWNEAMAARFPNADHSQCRQEMWHDGEMWRSFSPVRCGGWHCNRCGAATNGFGHHECPDRPKTRSGNAVIPGGAE